MSDITRRGFLGLAGAAAAGVTLSSCAGTGSSPSGSTSGAGAVTQLDFWSNHPGQSKDVEQALLTAYEKATGVKVKLTDAGKNYEEVATKLNAALSGSQLPDAVVLSDVTWFNFALNKKLASMDDLLGKASLGSGDYVDSLYADYKLGEAHYALPYARSTPLFYYNKDVFAAAGLPDRGPKTWQEFAEWAPKLAKAAGADKSALIVGDGTSYLEWYFQGMIWSFGGSYSTEWNPTFTDPKSIEAGEFLKKLAADKHLRTAKEAGNQFSAGVAACLLESTGALKGVAKNAKFSFGTAFLPAPEGVKACPTGGAGIAIPAGLPDERKLAAVKFVEWLTNPASTVTFTQATGYMPVRKSAVDTPEEKAYLDANPNAKTAVLQLPHTRSQDNARVLVPGGGARIGQALDKVVAGGDVKALFEGLQRDTQQAIDRDIKPKL